MSVATEAQSPIAEGGAWKFVVRYDRVPLHRQGKSSWVIDVYWLHGDPWISWADNFRTRLAAEAHCRETAPNVMIEREEP